MRICPYRFNTCAILSFFTRNYGRSDRRDDLFVSLFLLLFFVFRALVSHGFHILS